MQRALPAATDDAASDETVAPGSEMQWDFNTVCFAVQSGEQNKRLPGGRALLPAAPWVADLRKPGFLF
jgi:hypothetical protein